MFTSKILACTVLSLGLVLSAAGCSGAGTGEPTEEVSQFEVHETGVLFVGTSFAVGSADLAAIGGDGNAVDVVEGDLTVDGGGTLFALPNAKSWYESLLEEHGAIEIRVYPGGMDSGEDGVGIKKQAIGGGWGSYCQCGNCGTNYCGGCNNCAPCRCGQIFQM